MKKKIAYSRLSIIQKVWDQRLFKISEIISECVQFECKVVINLMHYKLSFNRAFRVRIKGVRISQGLLYLATDSIFPDTVIYTSTFITPQEGNGCL